MSTEKMTANELRKLKDRVIFLHEFAVSYEYPLEIDPHRGYISTWVTYDHIHNTDNPTYEEINRMSGDNDMIKRYFAEMAIEGTERIENF